jgi:hypothetical protein
MVIAEDNGEREGGGTPDLGTRFLVKGGTLARLSLPGLTRQSMTLKSWVNATLRSVVGKQNVGANPPY